MIRPPLGTGDLFGRLAGAQDAALDAQDKRRLSAIERALAGRTRPRRSRRPLALAGAGLVVAATAVALLLRPAPLRFEIAHTGAEGSTGRTLVAEAGSELPLRFSDGSTVIFQQGSSGRVQRLTGSGAEVVLEDGRLEAHVTHAETTRWLLHAGPFRVRVTGTRFTLHWSAATRALEVALHEGSVLVDGAVLGAGVPLRAGQRLRVDADPGLVRTEPLEAPAPAPAPVAPSESVAPSEPPAPEAAAVPAPAPIAAKAPVEPRRSLLPVRRAPEPALRPAPAPTEGGDWLALAERGAYADALRAAERLGLPGLRRDLDARGLLTLGDVARYAGERGEARLAFKALVARFPKDALAADAVFSLGRLAFEARRYGEAAEWFQRYVSRFPAGPLAEQASGRLIECALRVEDTISARGAARAYLERAPQGAHAPLARAVLANAPGQ